MHSKFYHQLTGEERSILFIFDDFHFCRSRVIGLDMTENRMFTLCKHNSSYRTTGFVYGRTDGHGETRITPYNFVAGGIIKKIEKASEMQQPSCKS
jgi:hypothetical protein